MRVLITGITGFAGSHLADYCLTRGDIDVHGIIRWRSRTENIEHL
ncbi:MAG TPA: GDP-mannose 4,6-dehydratase, partial [Candidatus Krumholzibacteria bacterium]|nr:GDP-mannose 4,6-dehydratase [Candidatus Krumholzibacteria bacterium]